MILKQTLLKYKTGEEVYMDNIPGYERPGYVVKLVRALYGLKQSPKHWADLLSDTLKNLGYKQSNYDSCCYRYIDPSTKREIYIACYVDDLLVVGDQHYINELLTTLKGIFTVRDLGEPSTFLGMEITRNKQNKTLSISQSTYIKNIAEKFGVTNNYKISTPMDSGAKLTEKDNKEEHNKDESKDNYEEFVTKYRSIIGSCMYAQMLTRPDISYAVSKLSKYLNKPTKAHMKAALRLLTYLYHTHDKCITYGNTDDNELYISGWSDSDHAGDLDDRTSRTGWIYKCNGGPISWRSILQTCIALCTAEAEYVAASDAAKEARSLLKLAQEMIDINTTCIPIHIDNHAAESWTRNPSHASKTKHIDVAYHHIRDEISKGRIKMIKVPTSLNLADIFTKPLNRYTFDKLCTMIFGG